MSLEHIKTPAPLKRRFLFHIKRGLKWIGVFLIAILVLGVGYQALASEIDKRSFQPSGQMVDVDGHLMHLYCTGDGNPTIILEAGAYSFSTEWYWVQQQLEQSNRVCSYDRAGNGYSDPVDGARDGLVLVNDLHRLLERAGVESPYVIAGHSLGGVLAAIYAAQYPDEVLGLVLVDSAVPQRWTDYAQFEQYLTQFPSPYMIMNALTRIGVTRLILASEFASYGYPAAVTAELSAFKATTQGVDTWNAEVREAQWQLGQQLYAIESLGQMPIVVLWASNPGLTTPEDRAVLEQIWEMLPTFSDNTAVQVVDGADHGSIVGNEMYALQITDAVLAVIESARTGEPLAR